MRTDQLTAPTKGRTFFRMVIAAAVSAVLIYGIVCVMRIDIEGYANVFAYFIAISKGFGASLTEELAAIGVPKAAMIGGMAQRLILLTAFMAFIITAGFVITTVYDLAYFIWSIAMSDGSAGYDSFDMVNRIYAVVIHMINALMITVSFSWVTLIAAAVLCTTWVSYGISGEFVISVVACAVYAGICIAILVRWAVKKARRIRAAGPGICSENVGSYSMGLLMAVMPLLVFLAVSLLIGLVVLVIAVKIAASSMKYAPLD